MEKQEYSRVVDSKILLKIYPTNPLFFIFAPDLESPHPCKAQDSVAQLVEQLTLNQWVESSSLSGVTMNPHITVGIFLFYSLLVHIQNLSGFDKI